METSIFIAQLLGPIMALIGIRLLFSKDMFSEAKTWLKNEGLAVYMAALGGAIAGILMVTNHNIWTGEAWLIIITLIGWLILIKSAILLACPTSFNKLIERINYPNWLIRFFGILYILIGIYLINKGFFI